MSLGYLQRLVSSKIKGKLCNTVLVRLIQTLVASQVPTTDPATLSSGFPQQEPQIRRVIVLPTLVRLHKSTMKLGQLRMLSKGAASAAYTPGSALLKSGRMDGSAAVAEA